MRYILAILLFTCATVLATNPFFFGLTGSGSAGGSGSSFSCSSCWPDVSCNSASSCSTTSATKTVTGSGTLKFDGGYTHIVKYSDNGGALTTIADGGTLSWTSGHTLAIQISGLSPTDADTVVVTDNAGGGLVGSFFGQNVHP